MIVGPTSNLWVELIDQIGGRHANPGFDRCSDSLQEGFNVLLNRPASYGWTFWNVGGLRGAQRDRLHHGRRTGVARTLCQ